MEEEEEGKVGQFRGIVKRGFFYERFCPPQIALPRDREMQERNATSGQLSRRFAMETGRAFEATRAEASRRLKAGVATFDTFVEP